MGKDSWQCPSTTGKLAAECNTVQLHDMVTECSCIMLDLCSIPFALEDVSKAMPPVTAANTPVPASLRDNSAFIFLQGRD